MPKTIRNHGDPNHEPGADPHVAPTKARHGRAPGSAVTQDAEWGVRPAGLSPVTSFLRAPKAAASRSNVAVPPFPMEVLPPVSRRLVEEEATALRVPPDFVAVPHLVFAGTVIGRTRHVVLKRGYRQYPALFGGAVGLPGSTKSPALEAAQHALNVLQDEALEQYLTEKAAYQQAVSGRAPTGEAGNGPRPTLPTLTHFFTTDATFEALGPMAQTSPGVAVVRDEIVSLVKSFDMYRAGKGADRQNWLSIWSSTPMKVDRVGREGPIYVRRPVVGVVGGIQPAMLPELHSEAGRQDGFIERFLIAWPDPVPSGWSEDIVSDETHGAVIDLFRRIRTAAVDPDGAAVLLSAEARSVWASWYDQTMSRAQAATGVEAGFLSKQPNQAARLGLILHCLAHPDPVDNLMDAETLRNGIALAAYFHAHMRRVLSAIGSATSTPASAADPGGRVAEQLLRALGSADGWLPRTELHKALGNGVPAATITGALHGLEAAGRAQFRRVPTEGRPAEEWRLVGRTNEESAAEPSG